MGRPPISCIMPVSPRHRHFVVQAVECFNTQAFIDAELIQLPEIPGVPLGQMRNHACQMATADLITHWDVDDWSGPDRLKAQYEAWLLCRADLIVSRSLYFWDQVTESARLFSDDGKLPNLGSTFLYTRQYWEANPFPAKGTGEDASFMQAAKRSRTLGEWDARPHMVARDHESNTCDRRSSWIRSPDIWRPAGWEDLPAGFREIETRRKV